MTELNPLFSQFHNKDACDAFQGLLDENGSVGKDQIKLEILPAQMGNDLEGDSWAIDIYQPDLYECSSALYGSEKEAQEDYEALLALCNDSKLFKIPCSWEAYGHTEVRADSLEEAIEIAECDETPLPPGSYIEGSFKIDHSAIELMKEEETTNE